MWDRLISKHAPHTASSLLKLKSEFRISKLESMEMNTDEYILTLEGLRVRTSKLSLKGNITDEDFMINILNNLIVSHCEWR